MRKIFTSLDFW